MDRGKRRACGRAARCWVAALSLWAAADGAAETPADLGQRAELGDDEAYSSLCRLADQGDPEAQNALGEIYQRGGGGEAAEARALEWYAMAASRGYARAQHNLGVLFLARGGSAETLAVQWFRKAAEAGYTPSQLRLAELCAERKGAQGSVAEGVKWLTVAAARSAGPERERLEGLRAALEAGLAASELELVRAQARLWLETHGEGHGPAGSAPP